MSHTFIAHDCLIGEKSVILFLGNATIGREVYLGANSVVHQNCTVGDLSLLGANLQRYFYLIYAGKSISSKMLG